MGGYRQFNGLLIRLMKQYMQDTSWIASFGQNIHNIFSQNDLPLQVLALSVT